jgi:hypothetical protein
LYVSFCNPFLLKCINEHETIQKTDKTLKVDLQYLLDKGNCFEDKEKKKNPIQFDESDCPEDKLIGVKEVVESAFESIKEHMKTSKKVPEQASEGNRTSPTALCSFARGGKTTIIKYLYDKLRDEDCHPLCITFNGNGARPFKKNNNESDAEALTRVIAAEIINYKGKKKIVCSIEDIEEYFRRKETEYYEKKGKTMKIVLLIDEVNRLSENIGEDAANILRNHFLDKYNRYLVFSSHIPMDPTSLAGIYLGSSGSDRIVNYVNLPRSFELEKYKKMHPKCEDLNLYSLFFYGG